MSATAAVFLLAFKGLPPKERQSIIKSLLKDRAFREDLIDIAIIDQRRDEPSRPLDDYLVERKRRKS